jgi:hypothetical protein
MVKLDKKTIRWILIALVIIVVIGFAIYKTRTKSTYVYPDTVANVPSSTLYGQLDADLAACNDKFETYGANPSTTNLATCQSDAMTRYISNTCPAVINSITSSGTCTSAALGGNANNNCGGMQNWASAKTQLDNDLTAIKNSYADMISRATLTFTPASGTAAVMPSATVLEEAKKADIRGATRRYLASVCSGTGMSQNLYSSNTLNTSTSTYSTVDPTNIFKTFSTSSSAGNYYFSDTRLDSGAGAGLVPIPGGTASAQNATIVTSINNINKWVSNAVAWGTTNEISYTGGALPTNVAAVGTNATNTYSDNIPRWAIATNFGPGTVIKTSVPITWKETSGAVKTNLFNPPASGVLF